MGWQAGELYESSTRDYVRLGMKFWVYHGRRVAGGGRTRGRGGRVRAALEALLAADGGVDRQEHFTRDGREFTRVHERLGKKFSVPHGKRAAGGKCRQGVPSFLRPLQGVEVILFFLCVVAAGGRLTFFWRYETKVAHYGIFCFGLVNCCRPRRAVRQFLVVRKQCSTL